MNYMANNIIQSDKMFVYRPLYHVVSQSTVAAQIGAGLTGLAAALCACAGYKLITRNLPYNVARRIAHDTCPGCLHVVLNDPESARLYPSIIKAIIDALNEHDHGPFCPVHHPQAD